MDKPVLLDLFCGAGGAARGYQEAGFYVVGVDHKLQPRYAGDEFVQADALEYCAAHGAEFDAIHASPPCQAYSNATPVGYKDNHPDLIGPTREALRRTGKPFVIENVSGARALLNNPVMLCGSMFGLRVQRHRFFEIWPDVLILTLSCNHSEYPVLVTGTHRRVSGRFEYTVNECREAMGISWMTRAELDEAIPPAYAEFIGKQLLQHIMVNGNGKA